MNPFAISGILTAIAGCSVGFLVLLKNIRSKQNLVWFAYNFCCGIWGISVFAIATTQNVDKAFFWWKFAHVGCIFMPILLLHFVFEFLEIRTKRVFLASTYVFGLLLTIINCFTPYLISNMRFVFSSFYLLF